MVEDGSRDFGGGQDGGERVLSQKKSTTCRLQCRRSQPRRTIPAFRAIIDSGWSPTSVCRMLEIVFDRLVRLMHHLVAQLQPPTRRGFARSDHLRPVRRLYEFDPLPAVLCVFKAEEWKTSALATWISSLIIR